VTGLTTYSWDFGDGAVSNDETAVHQYTSSGTYTVRLDISDGTCSNFSEQEVTIYPEPPVPTFEPVTLACINESVSFTNTTDDSAFDSQLTYTWDFNGEGSSDAQNPTFAFTSSGTKQITVTASIPGCETTSLPVEMEVLPGPTADFFAASVCQEDAIRFTNTSSDAVTYFWDFGDGFTSTSENPDHVYSQSGNFGVTLTATDVNGCTNTFQSEVAIASIPQVDFDFDVPCTSEDGISFTDLSTVENADLVAWSWRVNDLEVSTEQNPSLTFSEVGSQQITLAATSSNGCESTYSEEINVISAPVPDFSFTLGCQGESSFFEDLSVAQGSAITSWLWDVNGIIYDTKNISHVFEEPGSYEVMLEVSGQNFCSESITRTIEILQLPHPDFTIDGGCDNEFVTLTDNSDEFNDPIVSRRWRLDDQLIGNGSELLLENRMSGTYQV